MSELIDMTKVFIIESPSDIDVLDKRNEGEALGKALELAKIDNETYTAVNKQTLIAALERVSKKVLESRHRLGGVHVHFSMHGADDGLSLTDGKFINWKEFYEIIKRFNDKIGYIETPNGLKIAPTYLSFSVCNGYAAIAIKEIGEESPYSGLIGPSQTVSWPDSLLAFSIFFHNTIVKKLGIKTAIKNMNEVVGLTNVFKADAGKGMKIP